MRGVHAHTGRVKNYTNELTEDIKSLMEEGVLSAQQTEFCAFLGGVSGGGAGTSVRVTGESFIGSGLEPRPREILTVAAKQLPPTAAAWRRRFLISAITRGKIIQCTFWPPANSARKISQSCSPARACVRELDYDALEAEPKTGVTVACGALSSGMEYPAIHLAVLTEGQILAQRRSERRAKPKTARNRIKLCRPASGRSDRPRSARNWRFVGIEKIKTDHVERDYIKLQYSGTDVLFIPATQLDMVSKYIGSAGEDTPVRLNKLSGTEWHKTKTRKDRRARYGEALDRPLRGATRLPGFAFPPDDDWQHQFEDAFEYDETEDQPAAPRRLSATWRKPIRWTVCSAATLGLAKRRSRPRRDEVCPGG